MDLRTTHFVRHLHKTIEAGNGTLIDMYRLTQVGKPIITVGVPHGDIDTIDFIVSCLQAGQAVLRQLPPGVPFDPVSGMPKL